MGCDIHLYKEKQIDGQWLTADEWAVSDYGIEVPWQKRFTGRDYQLFGLLAKGVRSDHPYSFALRGLPFNLCAEIAGQAEQWGEDGHSHSYLYLHELKDLVRLLETQTIQISGMKDRDELAKLHESIAAGQPDWDLLFPYCRWGNSSTLEEFELDVPALFYVGGGLREIIAGFDGVDGENHRVVFFFDN